MVFQFGLEDLSKAEVRSHIIRIEFQGMSEVLFGLIVVTLQAQNGGVLDQGVDMLAVIFYDVYNP